MDRLPARSTCTFAWPGTYGHECGQPATLVGVAPSKMTTDGIFYARRCAKCAQIIGGENTGVRGFWPYDPALHVNKWK